MTAIRNDYSEKEGEAGLLPLLPLRDIVIFPTMMVPLFVGRDRSVQALEAAANFDKRILLAAQKNAKTEDPRAEDIHSVGTVCQIIQLLKLPDGTVKVLVEGKQRARILDFPSDADYFLAQFESLHEPERCDAETSALMRSVKDAFDTYAKLTGKVSTEVVSGFTTIAEPSRLADSIVPNLNLKLADRQALLEILDPASRLERLLGLLEAEIEILQIEKKIRTRVKKQMEKSQKEYYLNEQMRAIQKELGSKDELKQEILALEEKIGKKKLSKEAREKSLGELKKLKLMAPMSAEAAVVRNYIDWMVSLPWGEYKRDNHDIDKAESVLEADHYGLEKVKERVLEYLSVQALVRKIKGPILCLVGPPGVGKTSLARSIATATGRNFVKMSLGGVRDEAEIRGHRRTYVGAMPGKIIQSLKKAGSSNPVFLLDEIDKMSVDFRGDPASALLEVLDPEQNLAFNDHFLDVEYDLSNVMFIATANSLHTIPRPLLDRMEVIRIGGYTESEKLHIARRYLVPKQMGQHGLEENKVSISDRAILEIIRCYTREAGVRNLEREIAAICRKVARRTLQGRKKSFTVQPKQVREFLGVTRYSFGMAEEKDSVGMVTGLAWTEVGGELLNIEVAVLPGKGKLTVTGKLGAVMQESAQAAMTYVRSRARILGLDADFYQNSDIHLHVPEGAIPKDGPSAGITMATALASAFTGIPVRRDVAMTGEITLRGNVLPIGGLKEKLLAARRANIRKVLIPKDNEKDLADIPPEILSALIVLPVAHMDEVLSNALLEKIGMGKGADATAGDQVDVQTSVIAH